MQEIYEALQYKLAELINRESEYDNILKTVIMNDDEWLDLIGKHLALVEEIWNTKNLIASLEN